MATILLAHGLLGYRSFLLWEMFAGVKSALEAEGHTVIQPRVHPTASIASRAQQLYEEVTRTVGDSGAFHIIGHSMGGLDARYLASPGGLNLGERIASITTLSTPHHGSPAAAAMPKGVWKGLEILGKTFSRLPIKGDLADFCKDIGSKDWNAIADLGAESMISIFNPKVTDHPSTKYYSYAGDLSLVSSGTVKQLRALGGRLLAMPEQGHDGLVTVESARWGEFKGVVAADHGSIIGLKLFPGGPSTFDHVDLMRTIVREVTNI